MEGAMIMTMDSALENLQATAEPRYKDSDLNEAQTDAALFDLSLLL